VARTMSVSHASLVVSMYFFRASLPCNDTGVLSQHPIAGKGADWAAQLRQLKQFVIQGGDGCGAQRGAPGQLPTADRPAAAIKGDAGPRLHLNASRLAEMT